MSPEICTLDCGTMNFAEADYVMTNTPGMLAAMGRMITELGASQRLRSLIPGIYGMRKSLFRMGFDGDALYNYVWACLGAHLMI